jgi:hypothetical protein
MFLFVAAKPQSERFSKYKSVEAYEVRPGILMMPRYTEDGEVCEIGLERRHYTPQGIHFESSMPRKDIDEIVNEFAPVSERGPKSKDFGAGELTIENGGGKTTLVDYENVSLQIYSSVVTHGKREVFVDDAIAATILWKNRKCQ